MNRYKIQLIAAMVIFGTVGLVRKYIPYSSAVVAFARAFIGTIFLLIVHFIKKETFDLDKIKRNIAPLIASGVVLGVNWILLFEAYRFTTISVATICYYMAPVFIILISPLIFKERITLKKYICSIIAICGIIMVSGVTDTAVSGMKGIIFGLSAAVMYAGVIILNKKITGLNASDRTVIQLFTSAILLLPYILITENFAVFGIDTFSVIMLIVAGIVHTGIAYALYFGSMAYISSHSVAILSYIDPITAVILSVIVLKEQITIQSAVGVILVICATMVSEVRLINKHNKELI